MGFFVHRDNVCLSMCLQERERPRAQERSAALCVSVTENTGSWIKKESILQIHISQCISGELMTCISVGLRSQFFSCNYSKEDQEDSVWGSEPKCMDQRTWCS